MFASPFSFKLGDRAATDCFVFSSPDLVGLRPSLGCCLRVGVGHGPNFRVFSWKLEGWWQRGARVAASASAAASATRRGTTNADAPAHPPLPTRGAAVERARPRAQRRASPQRPRGAEAADRGAVGGPGRSARGWWAAVERAEVPGVVPVSSMLPTPRRRRRRTCFCASTWKPPGCATRGRLSRSRAS